MDLLGKIVTRFDDLCSTGELQWQQHADEYVEQNGTKMIFQISPHLAKKPYNPLNVSAGVFEPSKNTPGASRNPFLDPDPNFIISEIGQHHLLILNKFPVYRHSLLLHTKEFARQSDDLNEYDLSAVWTVLEALNTTTLNENRTIEGDESWLAIYNCGTDAGSSQPHKHLQIWPKPRADQIGFELFPSRATSTDFVASDIPDVPFKHFVLRLPNDASVGDVHAAYINLLCSAQECHPTHDTDCMAYNVALTREWICLIPRRHSGVEKHAGCNAAGMLGLAWVKSEEEKQVWLKTEGGLRSYLSYLGVPNQS